MEKIENVTVGNREISLDQVLAVAFGRAQVKLDDSPDFLNRLESSRQALARALDQNDAVYGVCTGFGHSCGNRIDSDEILEMGRNLIRYHRCGTGTPLNVPEARAAMFCRMVCLAQGYSGISLGLLKQMEAFLNHGITPVIPSEGSVGASGDLTPMSYVASALAGEHEVYYNGLRMPTGKVLEAEGIKPYTFLVKEALATMNGTSVMTGIAAIAYDRAQKIMLAALDATALSVHAVAGHRGHFHDTIFQSKPYAGQQEAGSRLWSLLDSTSPPEESATPTTLQDPYCLRCAPHVIGVLADALKWIGRWVRTEINSANDNPLLDPDSGSLLLGGNFYGGHIALAMDCLKTALASVADLIDRQVALLVDSRFSRGLPDNLVINGKGKLHHGFKGLQITASSLAAEALKNTMPATSFSRSTECHNQDKVSMGTIAARDALKQCDLVERVVAIGLLAGTQGSEIRQGLECRPALKTLFDEIRAIVPVNTEDRPQDVDIEAIASRIADGRLMQRTRS